MDGDEVVENFQYHVQPKSVNLPDLFCTSIDQRGNKAEDCQQRLADLSTPAASKEADDLDDIP